MSDLNDDNSIVELDWDEVPRPFVLQRLEDETGVSGTGIVATGVEFPDGVVALRWISDWPTSVVFHDRGMEAVEAVHGHGGKTRILWVLPEHPGPDVPEDGLPDEESGPEPIVITTQPNTSLVITRGERGTMAVMATGWDEVDIEHLDDAGNWVPSLATPLQIDGDVVSYTTNPVGSFHVNRKYRFALTNMAGTVYSDVVTVNVVEPTPPPAPEAKPGTVLLRSTGKGNLSFGASSGAATTALTEFLGVRPTKTYGLGNLEIRDGSIRQRYINTGATSGPPTEVAGIHIPLVNHPKLYLAYDVLFEPGWEWVRGGKLPGLGGGTLPTGGGQDLGGFSARFMWRSAGKLAVYLYGADRQQYGVDLPFNNVVMPIGVRFRIAQMVDVERGHVQGWFNNKLAVDVRTPVRASGRTFQIDTLLYSSFYGGNDQSWAPKGTRYARFGSFVVGTTPESVGLAA